MTTNTAITTTADPLPALLHLLSWASPAFPTGGFAYSHGVEWAVEVGDVRDEATAAAWLRDLLCIGAGRTDAVLLRHAHRGADVAGLAASMAGSAERRLETTAQGSAFAAASGAGWGGTAPAPYPVAFGALAAAHSLAEDDAVRGFLHAWCANLVSAAVRLVPLGQSAGLRILSGLLVALEAVVAATRTAGLDETGGACFRSDIAAMRHETQYTRLFRT